MEHLSNYSEIKDLITFSNINRDASFMLAEMANCIWQMEGSWELYEQSKQDFDLIVAKGYIKILEDKNIEFKDRLSFEYFYSMWFLKSSGIQENKSLKELANLVWHKTYKEKASKGGKKVSTDFSVISIILMYNFFFRNIFAAYFEDNENDLDEINWNAEKVIPYLNIDVNKLLLIAKEAQKTKESSMPGLANGIVGLIKVNPEVGIQLLQKVDSDTDSKIKGLMPAIISGLTATKGSTFTLPIIIEKLSSLQDYDVKNALFILSRFELNDGDWTQFGESIIQQLDLIEKSSNEEYKLLLPEVYVRHIRFLPPAKDYLLEYSRSDNPKFQLAMSNVLWFHTKKLFNEPWYETILLNSTEWDYSDLGMAKQMAFCLLNLVENSTTLSIKYLNAWIANEKNQLKQIRLFKHEIVTLFQKHQELMEEWITKSFLSFNVRYHRAMNHVISELWVSGFKDLSLSKKILDSCSFWDIKFILFKIMANVHGKESLESLVFSFLKKEPGNEPFWDLIANSFMRHICYNFGSAYTYLKNKENGASAIEKLVIKNVTEGYDNYYRHVDKIGKVNELKWQSKNGVNFIKIKMKKMSQEMEKNMKYSEENSFRSLFKSVNIKGGNKFFSKYEGAYTEPAALQSFESSFELPRGEMIDPLKESLNRMGWNNYKLES